MQRVLFLAYHFPPVGGAGVQRTVKFVRYLPASGYQPVVVTGPGGGDESFGVDETLAAELPADLEVARVDGPEPPVPGRARRRAERWLRVASRWRRWWVAGALEASLRVAPVDVLVATMSPFESAEAAVAVAHALRVPWVADLRDPWALDEMLVYPTRLHRRLERRRMRRALASAAAIVMNTREAARELVRAFPELATVPVHAIPNGFDSADFIAPVEARSDRAFRIVHTGELHTRLGRAHRRSRLARRLLGGAVDGVDILARSHVHLVAALERLRARDPALVAPVELHLAGNLSEADRAVAGGGVVCEHGYLAHGGSVALLRTADLLFLPMHGLAPGARARIVPGKTYEYLAAGRPILAAVPRGDARDLLAEAGNASVCDPADVEGIAEALGAMLERFRAGEAVAPTPSPHVVAAYDRRLLTLRLAAVLDAVMASSPAAGRPRNG